MAKVTSAEFQNAFGRYREVAQREPVIVTHHGRDSLVVLAADEYQRLRQQDRQALYAWELSDNDLKAVAEAEIPAEAFAFDPEAEQD